MIAEELHRIEQEIQGRVLLSRNRGNYYGCGDKECRLMTRNELVELGVTDLAENRVDKLLDKKAKSFKLSADQMASHW